MAHAIIERARAQGRTLLSEVESKHLLEEAGIRTSGARLATSAADAVAFAGQLGFPVVLKIASPDIAHKSDVGGVALNLQDAEAVESAFVSMLARVRSAEPAAQIDGISVQHMARPGIEVIAGVSQDAQFGPVLMFGLGGIFVEVLNDVSFRIVPVDARDVAQMVRDLRGIAVLQGIRGGPAADLDALQQLLLQLSRLAETTPEIAEIDLNPVFAYHQGAIAVDARVVLKSAQSVASER